MMCRYWTDHPPVHELVAAFMGVKPASSERPAEQVPASDLMAQFNEMRRAYGAADRKGVA